MSATSQIKREHQIVALEYENGRWSWYCDGCCVGAEVDTSGLATMQMNLHLMGESNWPGEHVGRPAINMQVRRVST